MNQRTRLEQAAIDAHRSGDTWATFWHQHAAEVSAAEPHDARRYHRLVRRLTALLAAGDMDGATAAGDGDPWELADDAPSCPASDTTTQARIDWQAAGIVPSSIGART